ncbi:unnamed protein product, partial [Discosporangium mesarthrocarpum]
EEPVPDQGGNRRYSQQEVTAITKLRRLRRLWQLRQSRQCRFPASKEDLARGFQGKAEKQELDDLAAILRTKVDESEHRDGVGRLAHQLAALSGEVMGVRADLRTDLDRVSSRVMTKVDADDLDRLRKSWG